MGILKSLIVSVALLVSSSVAAQSDSMIITKNAIRFAPEIQVGVLQGGNGVALTGGLAALLKYKNWSGGVGASIDNYYFRTIPVYLQLQKKVFHAANSPFVYGQAGASLPAVKEEEDKAWWNSRFSTGGFWESGLGYQLAAGTTAVKFSFGYSQKYVHEQRPRMNIWSPAGMPDVFDQYHYKLNRFVLKAAWGF